jgi:predicted Ser/Thr protein kinase
MQRALSDRLGTRYRLLERVGAGGMGTVYRAIDSTLDRPVAVKVVRRETAGPDAEQRLLEEARTMAKLRHANLCQVIEADAAGDPAFIVMEWVEGLPLEKLLVDLPIQRGLEIILDVADGAAEMHRAGLVHRDLKPANVLVDAHGRAIIVDFGLARTSVRADAITLAGTPAYSAPEQFRTGDSITPSADVFAIGRMLFELITSRRMADLASADAGLPLPEAINPDVSPALQRICLLATESDPARRYASARELGDDLRRHLRGDSVLARPSALASRFTEQVDEQLTCVAAWRRHGMISQPEHRRLRRILAGARRPESPWIMESRRLTSSQVTLYVGGWLVILALSVGMWNAWDHIASGTASAIAWCVQCSLLGTGWALHRARDRRFAMMWFTTAVIAWPVCAWLLVRQLNGPPTEFWPVLTRGEHEPGFGNAQLLLIVASWTACAAILRRLLTASVFTAIGVVALVGAWSAMWLVAGRLTPEEPIEFVLSEYAAWMSMLALLLVVAGLLLDRRDDDAGPARASAPVRDATPILSIGITALPLTLAAIAYHMPRRFMLATSEEPATVEGQAFGFIVSGVIIQICAFALARRETVLRGRLGELLRWVGPTFLIAPLYVLERNDSYGVWWLWQVLMAVGSLGFCASSVVREWKPYLFTGLAYLAIVYARMFVRVQEHIDEPGPLIVSIVIASAIMGMTIMVGAWGVPRLRRRREELHLHRGIGPDSGGA